MAGGNESFEDFQAGREVRLHAEEFSLCGILRDDGVNALGRAQRGERRFHRNAARKLATLVARGIAAKLDF